MSIRLDSFLSKYGISSRRKAKDLITKGQVSVNGETVYEVIKLNELEDTVSFKGVNIDISKLNFRYIMLNKPKNILSTVSDDRDRTTVLDLVSVKESVYPVGRLDFNSTGLILLTNDGDFTLKLTHPRFHVPKTYVVTVLNKLTDDQIKSLKEGVVIYDTLTLPSAVKRLSDFSFEIILKQGMKRQIREMCMAVGNEVIDLKRVKIGELELGDLKVGGFRDLTEKELLLFK